MENNPLTNEQRRQLIDVQQALDALRTAERELDSRFAGAMTWKTVNGRDYLFRRIGRSDRSLGPRSPETEASAAAFVAGKQATEDRIAGLLTRLQDMARVNVALRLGRVPRIVARILRRLDNARLLGSRVAVVGTNAMFAYEAAAGVTFSSGLLATGDIDFALDARRR